MAPTWPHHEATKSGYHSQDQGLDDAEKGLFNNSQNLPRVQSPQHVYMERRPSMHINTSQTPFSPIHEGITPQSSVPVLSLSWPKGWQAPDAPDAKSLPLDSAGQVKKPAQPKRKISRWILFQLWFNTYRKFFTFVTLLNLTGIVLAALGRFSYADNHLGALVLGNLLTAILMRNELFLRILYIVAIYGLRSVRSPLWPSAS
jgi:hypothetical protein